MLAVVYEVMMKLVTRCLALSLFMSLLAACASDHDDAKGSERKKENDVSSLTFAADVEPVTSARDAKPGVFIPPYLDCREPLAGETGESKGGKVCTHVAISGCTEAGKRFDQYASCDVVRTQRPFWPLPPAKQPDADDPRVNDATFMKELAWVKEQVQASGCVCCHSSKIIGGTAGEWDIDQGPIWLDTLSDTGLALFTGLADSSVLGAYPAKENHGFDRTITGLPSNDSERMQAFTLAELKRRGISQEEAAKVPPFGGPIYTNQITKPKPCAEGEGLDDEDRVRWNDGSARYVYVLEDDTGNPGVPPNLDTPEGTLWRLDVLASKEPIGSGVRYGTTPKGSFQAVPDEEAAPKLKAGVQYHLYVLKDVGLPLANCTFTYGEFSAQAEKEDAGSSRAHDAGEVCDVDGGDGQGFGIPCEVSADCPCHASYCALPPGQGDGYCSVTGCKEDASLCPEGWSCFDVSVFAAGQPSICAKP